VAIEALGLSPCHTARPRRPRIRAKAEECRRAAGGRALLLERDLKPLDILTRKSFENALTMIMAVGGSTNAVLHLLAIARRRRAAVARRFPARSDSRAAARRPQAERQVRAGGSATRSGGRRR
jgi:dihydroxy-acid dehydratase